MVNGILTVSSAWGVAIWASQKNNDAQIAEAARIPLEDEDYNG